MRLLPLILLPVLASGLRAQLPAVLDTQVNPATGHTYHLLDVSNWSDAEAAAVALGGHLITVDDAAEKDWMVLTFAQWGGVPRHLWIGLTDEVVEGTFEWVDGTPLSYTNWNWQEPNNALGNDPIHGEDYVTCYPDGEWLDLHDTNYSVWFPNLCGVVEIAGPSLSVSSGAPGGSMTFDFTNFTPGGNIGVVYGPAGTYTAPGGACAGLTVALLPLNFPPLASLIVLNADGSGAAQLVQTVPAAAVGLLVQAADVSTCTASNAITL